MTAASAEPVVETFTRRASIVGRVTDALTGANLQGAFVQITGMPEDFAAWLESYRIPYGKMWPVMKRRPDRTESAEDGSYVFCDLPGGNYTLTAVLPRNGGRYADKSGTASVPLQPGPASKLTEPSYATCDIALDPTAIVGVVTPAASPASKSASRAEVAAIQMAIVRIVGSGETTESASDGSYRLVAIQPGDRRVRVTARGYEPSEMPVSLAAAGNTATQNFVMTPTPVAPAIQPKER